MAEWLAEHGVELVVCAGYMQLLTPGFLARFPCINVHPSLLPAFPGLDAVGQALATGAHETGVTVHFLDEGVDTGPVIAQERVAIEPGDTAETLYARIRADRAPAAARRGQALSGRRNNLPALDGRAAGAHLRLRQDGPRPVRHRPGRAWRRARRERGNRRVHLRARPLGHAGRCAHRRARDARRPRQDAASEDPRRDPRAAQRKGGHGGARGARNRAVRPRLRQPLSLRAGRGPEGRARGRGRRDDRHRRPGDAPRRREELRARRAGLLDRPLRRSPPRDPGDRRDRRRDATRARRRGLRAHGRVRGFDRHLVRRPRDLPAQS